MNYVFMTDTSCDLTQELVNEIGVEVLPMEFHMEDKSYLHRNSTVSLKRVLIQRQHRLTMTAFTRALKTILKPAKISFTQAFQQA